MSTALSAEVLDDDVAMSLARGTAVANRAAKEIGVDLPESLVTITQVCDDKPHWRINYGPKNYRNRRGGDVIVEVGAEDASIQKVLRGQ